MFLLRKRGGQRRGLVIYLDGLVPLWFFSCPKGYYHHATFGAPGWHLWSTNRRGTISLDIFQRILWSGYTPSSSQACVSPTFLVLLSGVEWQREMLSADPGEPLPSADAGVGKCRRAAKNILHALFLLQRPLSISVRVFFIFGMEICLVLPRILYNPWNLRFFQMGISGLQIWATKPLVLCGSTGK